MPWHHLGCAGSAGRARLRRLAPVAGQQEFQSEAGSSRPRPGERAARLRARVSALRALAHHLARRDETDGGDGDHPRRRHWCDRDVIATTRPPRIGTPSTFEQLERLARFGDRTDVEAQIAPRLSEAGDGPSEREQERCPGKAYNCDCADCRSGQGDLGWATGTPPERVVAAVMGLAKRAGSVRLSRLVKSSPTHDRCQRTAGASESLNWLRGWTAQGEAPCG